MYAQSDLDVCFPYMLSYSLLVALARLCRLVPSLRESYKVKPSISEKCLREGTCTTFHKHPIFSKTYSVLCKVYSGYCGTSEIEHGLCACTVDNPLAKARGLSLRTDAQTMLYLSLVYSSLRYGSCYDGDLILRIKMSFFKLNCKP